MAKKKSNSLNLNRVLPAETAAKYTVTPSENQKSTRVVYHLYGEVDFRTMSVHRAAQLVKMGAPFIKEKTVANEGSDR
jgi:hypothetical protein